MPTIPRRRPAQQPRPRMSLRNAMRFHGLDEHKISKALRRQVNRLQRLVPKKTLNAAKEKLLLEVLKECVKIMQPAARANAPQDPNAFQLVHDIPRPPRQASSVHDATAYDDPPGDSHSESARQERFAT